MAKVEIDDKTIDKLVGKRMIRFNKTIRDLESKLTRRDNKIKKLERELEMYKSGAMETDKETSNRIAKIARAFVGELQRANWVEKYYECGESHCADDEG